MATCNLSLQPPSTFNFATPSKWPKWKRRFEQFRIASGLSEEEDARQISALMYCLGDDAVDVLTLKKYFRRRQEIQQGSRKIQQLYQSEKKLGLKRIADYSY